MRPEHKEKLDSWFGEGKYRLVYYNDIDDFTGCIATKTKRSSIAGMIIKLHFVRIFFIGGKAEISIDRNLDVPDLEALWENLKPAEGSCARWE